MAIGEAVVELVLAAVEIVAGTSEGRGKPRRRSPVRRLVDCLLVLLAVGLLAGIVYLAVK